MHLYLSVASRFWYDLWAILPPINNTLHMQHRASAHILSAHVDACYMSWIIGRIPGMDAAPFFRSANACVPSLKINRVFVNWFERSIRSPPAQMDYRRWTWTSHLPNWTHIWTASCAGLRLSVSANKGGPSIAVYHTHASMHALDDDRGTHPVDVVDPGRAECTRS